MHCSCTGSYNCTASPSMDKAWRDGPALLCVFADFFGLAVILPTLPFFMEEIGAGDTQVQEIWVGGIISAQYFFVLPGNLIWGYLCDRISSRRALQLSIVGDAICFFGERCLPLQPA